MNKRRRLTRGRIQQSTVTGGLYGIKPPWTKTKAEEEAGQRLSERTSGIQRSIKCRNVLVRL